jgi:tRNA U34 2-thiouridine synthase MnmA/TrmU
VFDTPVRGLAPGQALVLYDQDTGQVVVGAATILLPGPTLMEQQQS